MADETTFVLDRAAPDDLFARLDWLSAQLQRSLARLAAHHFAPGRDGPDLIQESFLRALAKGIPAASRPAEQLLLLMRRILRNCALNFLRSQRRAQARKSEFVNRMATSRSQDESPLHRLVAEERTLLLAATVARLSRRQRDVITWSFLEGASSTEIAARLGCSERAVRYIRACALRQLRWDLSGEFEELTGGPAPAGNHATDNCGPPHRYEGASTKPRSQRRSFSNKAGTGGPGGLQG
jgi:RNA polymerase sigma factor (sigma-70 family)